MIPILVVEDDAKLNQIVCTYLNDSGFLIFAYLLFPNTFFGALIVYALYQVGFIFGDYLGRTETLLFPRKFILSQLDKRKQIGYLLGLGIAFIFYTILEFFGISQKESQIYAIHFLLLLLQCAVFFTLSCAFRQTRTKQWNPKT